MNTQRTPTPRQLRRMEFALREHHWRMTIGPFVGKDRRLMLLRADIWCWFTRAAYIGAPIFVYFVLGLSFWWAAAASLGGWIISTVLMVYIEKLGRKLGWWPDASRYDEWLKIHGERP